MSGLLGILTWIRGVTRRGIFSYFLNLCTRKSHTNDEGNSRCILLLHSRKMPSFQSGIIQTKGTPCTALSILRSAGVTAVLYDQNCRPNPSTPQSGTPCLHRRSLPHKTSNGGSTNHQSFSLHIYIFLSRIPKNTRCLLNLLHNAEWCERTP